MERYFAGIDLGTTSMSATVTDENGRQIKSYTQAGYSKDAEAYVSGAISLLDSIIKEYPINAIGVTGQMHGVVLVDEKGNAVSRLYSWQEKFGDEIFSENISYTERLGDLTGYKTPTGYGFNSLFYLNNKGLIPNNAVSYCTLMDFLVLKLTGRKTPVIHTTNAASLGLFDLAEKCFDVDAVTKAGLSFLLIPEVTTQTVFAGKYNDIPVTVSIGDNQAAFLGSVSGERGTELSVNCGTGSQISLESDIIAAADDVRPFIDGRYLLTGCAICGGSAYAMLEKFFSECMKVFGSPKDDSDIYSVMNYLAMSDTASLDVDTRFSGTRNNPDIRGGIIGIDMTNFTPGALTKGMLCGMANELYSLYLAVSPECRKNVKEIVASGNALRKNESFRKIVSETFGLPVRMSEITEEAAYGAATFAQKAYR